MMAMYLFDDIYFYLVMCDLVIGDLVMGGFDKVDADLSANVVKRGNGHAKS
jgi:hypothetical protein